MCCLNSIKRLCFFFEGMPVLSEPPVVRSINHTQVTLAWGAYEPFESSENISISSYQVQMLSEIDEDWSDLGDVSVSSDDTEEYSFTTRPLELNQRYKFQVLIIWLNSNKPQYSDPSPETDWVHIACRGQCQFLKDFIIIH